MAKRQGGVPSKNPDSPKKDCPPPTRGETSAPEMLRSWALGGQNSTDLPVTMKELAQRSMPHLRIIHRDCSIHKKLIYGRVAFTFSERANCQFPFPNDQPDITVQLVRQGWMLYPLAMNPEVEELIRKLAVVNPVDRPAIDNVLQVPFFNEL
jgi:hypothetical protein